MRETDKPFVSVSRYLYPFIMLMKLLPIISIITSSILSIPYSLAQEKRTNNSPLYFGPNALPVPHMLEGRVSSRIYTELAYELGSGFYGDCTRTISAKINIPLFSPRINLSLWMPVIEFYKNSSESLILQDSPNKRIKGYEIGNVYISTDIHVIKQSKIRPDITIRAALITASGSSEEYSRYYDAPGYFFDASVSKSTQFDHPFFKSWRITLNGGFLCWQTGQSEQNDAYMYGIKSKFYTSIFDTSITYQGYSGWQNNGDRPMILRTDIILNMRNVFPSISFEHGFRDYPFNIYRFSIGYRF